MLTNSPCHHCVDRAIGCHGICKQYNDWAILHKEELAHEKSMMTRPVFGSDFSGTSPRPGTHRRTRRTIGGRQR